MASLISDSEDYSEASTLIFFQEPLPLLRGPVPAGVSDDPSIGPFVLAFRDASSWRSAYRTCESKVREQCEAGARIGCSINATKKCKAPWWRIFFGLSASDFIEREKCEEREMSSCLAASKESCIQFARDKCLPSFQDARIGLFDRKGIVDFMFWALPNGKSQAEGRNIDLDPTGICRVVHEHSFNHDFEMTNYRGSALINRKHLQNSKTVMSSIQKGPRST